MEELGSILLKKGDYVVEHLPDYFRKKDKSTYSSKLREDGNCFAGVIKKAAPSGCTISSESAKGVIIYYQKDVCPVIDIPGVGTYHIVNDVYAILFDTNI